MAGDFIVFFEFVFVHCISMHKGNAVWDNVRARKTMWKHVVEVLVPTSSLWPFLWAWNSGKIWRHPLVSHRANGGFACHAHLSLTWRFGTDVRLKAVTNGNSAFHTDVLAEGSSPHQADSRAHHLEGVVVWIWPCPHAQPIYKWHVPVKHCKPDRLRKKVRGQANNQRSNAYLVFSIPCSTKTSQFATPLPQIFCSEKIQARHINRPWKQKCIPKSVAICIVCT